MSFGFTEFSLVSFQPKDLLAHFKGRFFKSDRITDWYFTKKGDFHVAYLAVEHSDGRIEGWAARYSLYKRSEEFLICEELLPEDYLIEPCCCHCPKKILDRLSPTTNEWATEWRNRCRQNLDA